MPHTNARAFSWLVVLLGLSANTLGAPTTRAVADLIRSNWQARARWVAQNPVRAEAAARATLARANALPTSAASAQAMIEKYLKFQNCFLSFSQGGALGKGDMATLEAIVSDKAFPAADRSRAYFLIYLIGDDPKDLTQSFLLSPLDVMYFSKMKDPHFVEAADLMLAGCTAEEVDDKPEGSNPYSSAVRIAYDEWLAALYFQGHAELAYQFLWRNAEYFHFRDPDRSWSMPTPMFGELKEAGGTGCQDMLRCLLDEGRYNDIADIMQAYPDSAVEIQNCVSLYRLDTKRHADAVLQGTLPLMQIATEVPSGPASADSPTDSAADGPKAQQK